MVAGVNPGPHRVEVKHALDLSCQATSLIFAPSTPQFRDFGALNPGDSDHTNLIESVDFSLARSLWQLNRLGDDRAEYRAVCGLRRQRAGRHRRLLVASLQLQRRRTAARLSQVARDGAMCHGGPFFARCLPKNPRNGLGSFSLRELESWHISSP
jgi:hypothetical protein